MLWHPDHSVRMILAYWWAGRFCLSEQPRILGTVFIKQLSLTSVICKCGFCKEDGFWPCSIVKAFHIQFLPISVSLRDALICFTGIYKSLFFASLWTMPSSWMWGGTTQPRFVSFALTWHGGWSRAACSCIFISQRPNPALLQRSTT